MLRYTCKHGMPYNTKLVGTYSIVQASVLVNTKSTEGGSFLEECKFTAFGLLVKTELLKRGRSQTWLEKTVTEKTGLFVDSSYMYKILTGERNASKIVTAIREILDIRDTSPK